MAVTAPGGGPENAESGPGLRLVTAKAVLPGILEQGKMQIMHLEA